MWIDAHNHLQDPRLAGTLEELEALPMKAAVVDGTRETDWPQVADLAAKHAWVFPAFGLHPWFLAERTAAWRVRLLEALRTPRASIGEIGLDGWMHNPDFAAQEEVFRDQLAIAAERNLPVTIHCLKAWPRMCKILKTAPLPARGFLMHAFAGSRVEVRELLDLGAYFSFSGAFLHERKRAIQDVYAWMPQDRLLVETDAPAMNPPPSHQRHVLADGGNHPANIADITLALAQIRCTHPEVLCEAVAANFQRLFGTGQKTNCGW